MDGSSENDFGRLLDAMGTVLFFLCFVIKDVGGELLLEMCCEEFSFICWGENWAICGFDGRNGLLVSTFYGSGHFPDGIILRGEFLEFGAPLFIQDLLQPVFDHLSSEVSFLLYSGIHGFVGSLKEFVFLSDHFFDVVWEIGKFPQLEGVGDFGTF